MCGFRRKLLRWCKQNQSFPTGRKAIPVGINWRMRILMRSFLAKASWYRQPSFGQILRQRSDGFVCECIHQFHGLRGLRLGKSNRGTWEHFLFQSLQRVPQLPIRDFVSNPAPWVLFVLKSLTNWKITQESSRFTYPSLTPPFKPM